MKLRNSVTCNRLLPQHIRDHCREERRPPQWKQTAGMWSGGGPSVISDCANHQRLSAVSYVIRPRFNPPAALTPTIHNLCADQTSEKRKHRVVFMPLVATSPACVFFSGALSKSSQSPRPYKSAPPSCTLRKHWRLSSRAAVGRKFPC